MSNGLALLSIFVLAVFIGFEVVSKVSTTLHKDRVPTIGTAHLEIPPRHVFPNQKEQQNLAPQSDKDEEQKKE